MVVVEFLNVIVSTFALRQRAVGGKGVARTNRVGFAGGGVKNCEFGIAF